MFGMFRKRPVLKQQKELDHDYTLVRVLGRGSSSVVYEAVENNTKKSVAIKTVKKKALRPDTVKKLYREVDIMTKLSHENIIRLLDVYESPENVHLVMDLVQGGELFDKIVARGQYSESDAALLVTQIVSAVAYMHSHGVCHRDLKPENLLCAEDEELYIRIADFGLSKIYNDGENLTTICGTPDYVAPEILECQPYTEAVDMWAIGVITYTLLCGFTPFFGASPKELFQRILALDYDFPQDTWGGVSDLAKDFIKRLLVVEPSQRMRAQDALQHEWLRIVTTHTGPNTPLAVAQQRLASAKARHAAAATVPGHIIAPQSQQPLRLEQPQARQQQQSQALKEVAMSSSSSASASASASASSTPTGGRKLTF